MLTQRVLGRVILFEMDDPLGNGNFDSGLPQRCVYRDRHIALHKGELRHVFSREAEYEHKRVFGELLQYRIGRGSFENVRMGGGRLNKQFDYLLRILPVSSSYCQLHPFLQAGEGPVRYLFRNELTIRNDELRLVSEGNDAGANPDTPN